MINWRSFVWAESELPVLFLFTFYVALGVFLSKLFHGVLQESIRKICGGARGVRAPEPRGWPVLGHLPRLGTHPHEVLTQWRKTHGDIYKVRMGSKTAVIINGYETTLHVLLKRSGEFDGRPDLLSFRSVCNGECLINNRNYAISDEQRRIAVRALNTAMKDKENLDRLIGEQADNLIKKLVKHEDTPHDPAADFSEACSSVIFALSFRSGHVDALDEQFISMVKSVKDFTDICKAGNLVDFFPWLQAFMPEQMRKFQRIVAVLPEICQRQLQERLLACTASGMKSPRDVMGALIYYVTSSPVSDRLSGLTNDHVFNLLSDLVGSGFHTTSTALNWVTLCLAVHPDTQQKARNEIHSVVGKLKTPSIDDMNRLPYVMSVIHESLRYRPVVPISLPRATTRDVTIGDNFIPEDTMILINYWSVCHDSDAWSDPHLFKPERLLQTDDEGRVTIKNEDKERVMGFSLGKRKCIGQVLALKEIFVMISALIQKTSISCVKGVDYHQVMKGEFGMVLTPTPYTLSFSKILNENDQI